MAVDLRFILTGAKRVFDSRPMYAQVVVTDDCNLTCSYCDEYTPGAPVIPLAEMKKRIDKLDELGVQVYDFLGGETMIHPEIAELVRYTKSKRGGSNLATIITNGFLLTADSIRALNEAGLDFMQVSVDSLHPTEHSDKCLKAILPACACWPRKPSSSRDPDCLNEDTLSTYEFRETKSSSPSASPSCTARGAIVIKGEKFLGMLEKYGVFEGVNFYGEHLKEMLRLRGPGSALPAKFLYINPKAACSGAPNSATSCTLE